MAYFSSGSSVANGVGSLADAYINANLIRRFAVQSAKFQRSQGDQDYQTAQDNIARVDEAKSSLLASMTENFKSLSLDNASVNGSITASGALRGDVSEGSTADLAQSQSFAYMRSLYEMRYNLSNQERSMNRQKLDLDLAGSLARRTAYQQADETEYESKLRAKATRAGGLLSLITSFF